jgi:hypothetical protein
MVVTLAQAMINAANDVDYAVIDDFRRYNNVLLEQIVFDDVVSPMGGGTLIYGYNRLVTPSAAQTRAVNSEYIPGKATRAQITVNLTQWGGAFELDRVLRNLGQAATNEEQFQLQQLGISTQMKFNEMVILGDTAVDPNAVTGLAKTLTGTSNEVAGSALDLRAVTINTQALALQALDILDAWLSGVYASRVGSGQSSSVTGALPPGRLVLLGNTALITRLKAIMRWSALYTQTDIGLGQKVDSYGPWQLVDLGDRNDGTGPIIPIGVTGTGETDLYAVSLGMDALHAASVGGQPLLQYFPPEWNAPGAVKIGELEMGPAALVLKSTKAAGVYKKIKVQ